LPQNIHNLITQYFNSEQRFVVLGVIKDAKKVFLHLKVMPFLLFFTFSY